MKTVVVFIKKTTYRYHFDRLTRLGLLSNEDWKLYTGTTKQNLLNRHERHLGTVETIQNVFKEKGYDLLNLKQTIRDPKNKIDLAVSIGGDGTFLNAAGWIRNRDVPIVGFNSDREASQGELCKFSPSHIDEFITKWENNELPRSYRTRVRTRLHGPKTCFKQIRNSVTHDVVTKKDAQIGVRILHEKALNEVFVGELDSTEPSHLEIEVDKSGTKQRIKCSGLLVSTGTGSSAWSQSVARIDHCELQELNRVLQKFDKPIVENDTDVIACLHQYRKFAPDDGRILVTIREPIQNRIYSCEKTRFFCNHLTVVSRCYSGMVSIDGKYRYSLPAGSKACFETNKETQLCTFDSLDSSG